MTRDESGAGSGVCKGPECYNGDMEEVPEAYSTEEFVRVFRLWARPWVTHILVALMGGPLGFSELRRSVPDISPNTLSGRLNDLIRIGLVRRQIRSGPPIRTIYSLTEVGDGVRPVAEAFKAWHRGLTPDARARLRLVSGEPRWGVNWRSRSENLHALVESGRLHMAPYTSRLLGRSGMWVVIARLMCGPAGFAELNRSTPDVPERQLATRLRELVEAGLVERQVYSESPLRAKYALTPSGESLRLVAQATVQWLRSIPETPSSRLLRRYLTSEADL